MTLLNKISGLRIIVTLFLNLGFLWLVPFVSAETHTAVSPSFADVSAAVSAAHSGDIVIIPAGSATWDSQLVITKGIYLKGAGIGHTVITSNYSPSIYRLNPDSFLMVYNPSDPEKNEPFRLSGFTFDCDSKCLPVFLRNSSSSPITKVRIDHIKTVNPQGGRLTIALHGAIWGVADNNIFDGSYTSVDGYDNEWSVRAFNFGTGDMFYFEDNTFVGRESLVIRSEQGARWCARYNTFDGQYMTGGTYPWFDMHGNQPNAWHAVMGVEVYGNIINLPSGYGCTAIDQRGGKLLYYNNTLNVQSSFIQSREEYNDSIKPPANNLVSGQPQHVSDSYYWNNLLNGMTRINTIVNGTVDYGGEKGIVPQENRDFWQQQLNFNGTIGVGVGLLTDRPETCTEGVAYWATDTNTLYKAAATNTWEAYYRPYVYPHPLRMDEEAIIGLNQNSLHFTATTENEAANQSFLIRNDGMGAELVWNVTDDAFWLNCTPTAGEGDTIVEVSVDSSGMAPGVYEAAISVSSESAVNSPVSVQVTLTINTSIPVLEVSTNSLAFMANEGVNPTSQPIQISNGGGGILNWTAAVGGSGAEWLAISPTSGTGNGTLTVLVDTNRLVEGTYSRFITIAAEGAGDSPQYVYVNLIITSQLPVLALSANNLSFTSNEGVNPASQSIQISNSGGGSLGWSAEIGGSGATWLSVSPDSGSENEILTVSVDTSGLNDGTYARIITFSSENAVNSPQVVYVDLTIREAGQAEPFGFFDSPADEASVFGSVPVTGWALDDVEVVRIEIKREPHVLDSIEAIDPEGLVFVGNACFVEGSRPDVEQIYESYPFSSRAGWGYMMLTYGLPNMGNGTFVLYAFAYDSDGNRTWLGKKTIHCNNANSDFPFGTIDTPSQGGTVSGPEYVNFGWALTPQPKTIPFDGSTITVWVDGEALGNPVYNNFRTDIAEAFPGYNNTNGAIGFFYIDTTQLANGMHTIGWTVTDNALITEGVGSRFFTVVNTESPGDTQSSILSFPSGISGVNPNALAFDLIRDFDDIQNLPLNFKPISVRLGYDLIAEPELLPPDQYGMVNIHIEQIERLEVGLEGRLRSFEEVIDKRMGRTGPPAHLNVWPEAGSWEGFLIGGRTTRPLPIGSHLDLETGVFTWQLGPAYLGVFRFVFIQNRGGQSEKIHVVVEVR